MSMTRLWLLSRTGRGLLGPVGLAGWPLQHHHEQHCSHLQRMAPVRSFSATYSLWAEGAQPKAQGHYTPITRKLWVERLAAAEKHKSDPVSHPITHKPPEVTRVVYPFSKDAAFKELVCPCMHVVLQRSLSLSVSLSLLSCAAHHERSTRTHGTGFASAASWRT